ncbi:hypothetical protein BV20DRAFT_709038 [Pilatotrama ljubarskyi]|nr:hypothetical protein BV20DRAFT_709038 [Pilatotrama ljubarskyi]
MSARARMIGTTIMASDTCQCQVPRRGEALPGGRAKPAACPPALHQSRSILTFIVSPFQRCERGPTKPLMGTTSMRTSVFWSDRSPLRVIRRTPPVPSSR